MATKVFMDFELPNRVVGDDEAKRLLMKLMDTAFAEVDGYIGHNRWCSPVERGVFKDRGEPGGHLTVSFDVNDDSIPLLVRKIFLRVWEEMSHAWLDVEVKATVQAKPAPKGLIIGIVIGVLVIGGAVLAKIKLDHAAVVARARNTVQMEIAELVRKQREQELAFHAQIAKLTKQLTEAKTEAEREALRRQIDEASSHRAASSSSARP
jgi:hypothetical protein